MKKLIILFILLVLAGFGSYLIYKEGTLPVDKSDLSSKIFVIRNGEGLTEVANNLSSEKLIRNKIVFYIVIKRLGYERKIQAGDFRISPSMDAYEIAKLLTHGTLDIWVTIIEGLRREEIAQLISQNLDIPESEFLKLAQEGYLFPDTYLFPKSATAAGVIEVFSNNFEKRYDENLKSAARRKGLSDDEVIILASLVEKEARLQEDMQDVASVLLKRLQNDWPLQVDATIQYALGYQAQEKRWWKTHLTSADLKIDTPYNTYKNLGLPPTPISNPGLNAIKAVVNANVNTPYWFYVSDKNGKLHFARTNEEHEANIRKYLR